MWGTIGIGYRKSKSERYPGELEAPLRFGRVLRAHRDARRRQHHRRNRRSSTSGTPTTRRIPARIKEVEELVIRQKPHIKAFAEDNGQDLLISGEVDLTMEWNGDILQVMAEDDDLGYSVPKEGGLLWEDTLAIPTGCAASRECPRIHQLHPRRGGRRRDCRLHLLRDPQRGGEAAPVRGVSGESRDLPAAGGGRNLGDGQVPGRRAPAAHRRDLDTHPGRMTRRERSSAGRRAGPGPAARAGWHQCSAPTMRATDGRSD